MARSRPIAGQRARANLASASPRASASSSPRAGAGAGAGAGARAGDGPTATTVLDALVTEPVESGPVESGPVESGPVASGHSEQTRPRTGLGDWSTGATALLAGLLVITLSALAAFGLVAYRVRAGARVETARDQASAAARQDAVSILSYDYRHLNRDFAAARTTLTGSFAKDYQATTSKLVRPGATQYHVVVKAEVAAESVVSATANQVVVLLFVNQTTTSTRLDGPRVDLNRVRLTLVRVGGSWLVNNVVAL
jgi:Mce-associated membrane protein